MKIFLIIIMFHSIAICSDKSQVNLESDLNQQSENLNLEQNLDWFKSQYDTPPKLKKRLKIKGEKYKDSNSVTIKFFINEKGKTSELILIESSNNDKFDKDSFLAIKKSKWKPAVKDGKDIAAWHQLTIKF